MDAVLFDLEGVLLEGRSTPDGIYSDAVDSITESDSLKETEKQILISPEDFEAYRELCDDRNLDPEDFWMEKEDAASELEVEHIRDGGRTLVENAIDTLQKLDDRDIQMGIVSNNSQKVVDFVASHYELNDFMDVSYGLQNTISGFKCKKLNPHYIERALDDLESDSDTIFYVGDKISDVKAGLEAGIKPVLIYEEQSRLEENPENLPVYSISKLNQLLDLQY